MLAAAHFGGLESTKTGVAMTPSATERMLKSSEPMLNVSEHRELGRELVEGPGEASRLSRLTCGAADCRRASSAGVSTMGLEALTSGSRPSE